MQYMNDIKCPYKILIADGGEDKSIEAHLLDSSNYPNLNYEYIRYSHDVTLKDYLLKLEDVLTRVRTKYVLNADNDDFYLFDRIQTILSFLDKNEDYVACRGLLVNLSVMKRSGEARMAQGDHYLAFSTHANSIEDDDAFDRVDVLCRDMSKYDYYGNWYSVLRTSAMLEVWKSIVKLEISEMIVNEMLTHILINMRGKTKIFTWPFYIRQSSTSQFGDTLVVNNEFLERCLINNNLSKFINAIETLIPFKSQADKEHLLKSVAAWFEVFIYNICLRDLSEQSNHYRFKKWLKRFTIIDIWAWKIYHRIFYKATNIKSKHVILKEIEPYILLKNLEKTGLNSL